MRVTTKGQVTIPRHIRDSFDIGPGTEVDFIEENGRVYLIRKERRNSSASGFGRFRGAASVKMSTDEIMTLTREYK